MNDDLDLQRAKAELTSAERRHSAIASVAHYGGAEAQRLLALARDDLARRKAEVAALQREADGAK